MKLRSLTVDSDILYCSALSDTGENDSCKNLLYRSSIVDIDS